MFVNITCEKCQKTRYIPWRWDWGLDPDVVSLQRVYRCHGKPRWAIARWIALDPAFQAENEAVRRESDQYFVAFQEAKAKAKEAKKAKATESGEAS